MQASSSSRNGRKKHPHPARCSTPCTATGPQTWQIVGTWPRRGIHDTPPPPIPNLGIMQTHVLMSGSTVTVECWAHAETLKKHCACTCSQQQCQAVAD